MGLPVLVVYVFFVTGQLMLLSISMSMIVFMIMTMFMKQLLFELVSLMMPVVRFNLLLLQFLLQ